MKKSLCIFSFISVFVFSVGINGYAKTGSVNTDSVNLRDKASTSSDIIRKMPDEASFEILDEENGWYKVQYNDIVGYISKDFVKVNDNNKETENKKVEDNGQENNNSKVEEKPIEGKVEKNTSSLNTEVDLRILPLINSKIVGKIKLANDLKIISKTNKWAFVENDELSGWVVLSEIEGNAAKEVDKVIEEKKEEVVQEEKPVVEEKKEESSAKLYDKPLVKYVKESSIYIRSNPSTKGDVVTTLIRNTDVTVVGEDGEWYKVTYGNSNGYIRKDLLSDTKIEDSSRSDVIREANKLLVESAPVNAVSSNVGNQIVDFAKKYLGCPYVYGAAGSSSFDCSGFTMYVYKNFGYSLSHSAQAQSSCGTYVAKENLQPGDLVFFLDYPSMDGIGHCGIYIGDGNFIHASSGSGYCVKVSTLLSGSYYNRYATARRLVN